MQQVKMFSGLEGATEELSREINSWIRESGAKVIQISGNIAPQSTSSSGQTKGMLGSGSSLERSPSDVLVIILYEE